MSLASQNPQISKAFKRSSNKDVDVYHHGEKNNIDGSATQAVVDEEYKSNSSNKIPHPDNIHNYSIVKSNYYECQNIIYCQVYQDHELQYFDISLDTQSIQQVYFESMLLKLLKRTNKCQYTKKLINLALKRPQSKYTFLRFNISREQRQKLRNQLKILNEKILFSDETNARLTEQNIKYLEYFIDLLSEFEMNDYAYLFHLQQKLQYFIGHVMKNWDFLRPFYQPYFERFLDLIKIKIEFMSQSRIIYPALYRIQKRLQTKMGYKGSRKKLNVDDHLTDLLFQHYIQQLQTRSNRNGIYYVRDPKTDQRTPLSEYIASCKQYFDPLSGWKEIFFIISQHVLDREAKNDPKYDPKKEDIMNAFVENIPNIIFPTPTCLGCSQFFYANQNIYRPDVCQHLVALLGEVSQMPSNVALIKDQICALLNGKGGVLLFDCTKTDNTVIPRGTVVIQNEKKEIQIKLKTYLDGIYPKPEIDKNISISWVSLVEDPFEAKIIPKKQQQNFQEGVYVARILVKPTHGHITYFWTQDDKPIFSIRKKSLFPEGKQQISGRSIHKLIKNKFNEFKEEFMDLHPIERKVIMKPVCTMDHVCKKPENGIKLHQKKKEEVVTIQHPELKFNYASVAVAKSSDRETIRKNLLRYKIQNVIVAPFETLKLKGAAQSSILYHSVRFDQLQSKISNNKDFEFGGRNLLVIPITQFIRLTERNQRNIMPQGDFNSLTVWLHKQYPKQTLKMWRFITDNNDQEFYIQTESKESSLYIYIVMTQFLERSAFKNPKGLERMDDRERQSRLRLVYPFKK